MSERIEKFTPEPWTMEYYNGRLWVRNRVGYVANLLTSNIHPDVCAENRATATLVRAAPTLYAALVSVVVDWHLEHGDPVDGPQGTLVNPPKPDPIQEAEIAICDAILGPHAGLRARHELIETIVERARQEFYAIEQADGMP